MPEPSTRIQAPGILAVPALAVPAPVTLTDTASDTLHGIGFVVLAYFLLTVGDVATKLVRELDRDITFMEVAGAIARGYSNLLGGGDRRELTALENAHAERRGAALEQRGWLQLATGDNLTSRLASQLGSIEARAKNSADGAVESIGLFGDLIANSAGIAALQSEIIGRHLDLASVSTAVMKTFGHGDNFILGIGELANLVKLITRVQ